MVYFLLSFTADLRKLTNLQPQGGCDDPNFPYYFKLKCENCGEVSQKEACVVLSETLPLSNGKSSANLVQKCKLCGREGSIQMIPGQGQPLTAEDSEANRFSPLMVFDCRGYEPIEFTFGNGWKAESETGTVYDIDLSEMEFNEYDVKGHFQVDVSDVQYRFRVVKKHERRGKPYFQ